MNISIEVINEQGIKAKIPTSVASAIRAYPPAPSTPIGALVGWVIPNQKFIDIVTGTDGTTYTLKIKQNPGKSLASSHHSLTVGCSSSVVPCPASAARGFNHAGAASTQAFGTLSNPIFIGLSIFAATFQPADLTPGSANPAQYGLLFPAAGYYQLLSMNISLEVTNNQESASTTTTTMLMPGVFANGDTGTVVIANSINPTFISIVNTVGSTYTLIIKQNT